MMFIHFFWWTYITELVSALPLVRFIIFDGRFLRSWVEHSSFLMNRCHWAGEPVSLSWWTGVTELVNAHSCEKVDFTGWNGCFWNMAPSYIIRVVFKAFDFQPFRLLFLGSGSTATRSRFHQPRYGDWVGGLGRRTTASHEINRARA